MKANEQLNFVVPIFDEKDRPAAYVHAAPIGRQVFERYYMVLAKTFTSIFSEGLGFIGGPRIALLRLKDLAQELGDWDGPDGVEQGLVAEMRRLSNALVITPNGWQQMPLEDAVKAKFINEDDAAEVESAIAFFIVVSAMLRPRKTELKTILDGAAKLWAAQISSLDFTAFVASLPTSSADANSGATAKPSSIPY